MFSTISKHVRFLNHNLFTTSSHDLQQQQQHVITSYLINTLNFTQQEATTSSPKLQHLKTTKNPQNVISFLKTQNISDPLIKSLILSQPTILLRQVNKTLVPKFNLLSEIGFSGSELVHLIKKDQNLLSRSLGESIVPTFNFLLSILGSKEKVVKAIKKSYWPFYGKWFRTNVGLLENYGVGVKDIGKIIIRNPRLVTGSPVKLEEKLCEVEREFGIKPGSSMFSYGLSAICSMNKENLRKKFGVFRRFGWCHEDVLVIAKSQPICLTHSEERLGRMLEFFMGELGYEAAWLASRGSTLMYSLEKRVKPRYGVFKVLKENRVMVMEFHSMLCLSDVDFVKQILERYKEEIPEHLYESYIKNIKLQ